MKNPSLLWLDVVVVFAFVVVGRRSHDEAETVSGVLRTAAPFMLGLVAGWTVIGAWRRPAAMTVGAGVLGVTVIVGMLLRNVLFNEGTTATFIFVATLFLALGFLGWRLVANRIVAHGRDSAAVRD